MRARPRPRDRLKPDAAVAAAQPPQLALDPAAVGAEIQVAPALDATVVDLQVSAGLTYTWSASAAPGSKITELELNGVAIDPAANYQVTTNDFLANGGYGFTVLATGTGRTTAPGFDIDALVAYLGAGAPVAPGPANRISTIA